MRPFSARVDLQMRAADIEAGDDALSFFHASGFHHKGGRSAGRALRIIPVLDLKGGQVVRAEKGQARSLQADRDAAQRNFRCRRRRRRAALALPFPDLLHRRSRRHRGPRAEQCRAWPAESHARCAGTLGRRRLRRRDNARRRARRTRRSARCWAPNRNATTRCFGAFATIPTSSCRSISSATDFAVRRPFSMSPSCGRNE